MARILHAGPLSIRYENGDIRTLKLGDTEVIRRICATVRDKNWGTVPLEIYDEHVFDGGDHFRVTFGASHREKEISFDWRGDISGTPDASLAFSFEGEALSTFWRNRIGFSILHPIRECIGTPVLIEDMDGRTEKSSFPIQIAPNCPFQNLKAMEHQVNPDLWAKLAFEGDVFETEDQRNWADASFKTYCTPLELPFPVQIEAGTRISQRVTLKFKGELPHIKPTKAEKSPLLMKVVDEPCGKMPPLGLGIAQDEVTLTTQEIEHLKQLKLSHLRVDVRLDENTWPEILRRANNEALALGCQLEIALFTGENPHFEPVVKRLKELKSPVKAFLLFTDNLRPVSSQILQLARQKLSALYPAIPLGVGTNANYVEFNRNPPPVADFVVFSANPQVHAFDDVSLVETPEALGQMLLSARQRMPSNGVALSPLTLKPRFNASATAEEPELLPHELPANVDVRQAKIIGATWMLSAIGVLTKNGLGSGEFDSLTLFETTGWRGVMEDENRRNRVDASIQSVEPFPIWHVLSALSHFRGKELYAVEFGDDRRAIGLACLNEQKWQVLIANLSGEVLEIRTATPCSTIISKNLEKTHFDSYWFKPENPMVCNGMFEFQFDAYGIRYLELTPQ